MRTTFEIYQDTAGGWRWRLRARNGETVGSSEAYTRIEDATRGARTARRVALTATITTTPDG